MTAGWQVKQVARVFFLVAFRTAALHGTLSCSSLPPSVGFVRAAARLLSRHLLRVPSLLKALYAGCWSVPILLLLLVSPGERDRAGSSPIGSWPIWDLWERLEMDGNGRELSQTRAGSEVKVYLKAKTYD